jgi:hypothetical protein
MRADRPAPRRGLTYLEIQIAFAVLGVALSGLAPLAVAQLRLMERAEARVYCLFPSEFAADPPAAGAVAIRRVAPDPAGASSWGRTLGAAPSGWTLRAVEVAGRGPATVALRLQGDDGRRWTARRAPGSDGLGWADTDSGEARTPTTLYLHKPPRTGTLAGVTLDRDASSATVARD